MRTVAALVSLNLLVLRAADPDGLAAWYEALGLVFTRERHGNGPEHHACDLGSLVFEIYPRMEGDATSEGVRIGFKVESIDAVLAVLGDDVVSAARPWNGTRRCVLKDPEGHKVELVEA